MPSTPLTEDEYVRTIESLRGRRVVGVAYYPMACGVDGTEIEDWDFGDWHLPTLGVELVVDDGTRYSAVWDQSFDHYGLEVFRASMSSQLGLIGPPDGSPEVLVTGHAAWASLVGAPLTGAEILWSEGDCGRRMPVAVALSTEFSAVWLVAGSPARWPADGQFRLGTDDVMVVFTRALASSIGLGSITLP